MRNCGGCGLSCDGASCEAGGCVCPTAGRQDFVLAAARWQLQRTGQPNLCRDRFLGQGIEAPITEQVEHLLGFLGIGADVPV